MSHKRYLIFFMLTFLGLLVIIGAFNIFIDPYWIWHKNNRIAHQGYANAIYKFPINAFSQILFSSDALKVSWHELKNYRHKINPDKRAPQDYWNDNGYMFREKRPGSVVQKSYSSIITLYSKLFHGYTKQDINNHGLAPIAKVLAWVPSYRWMVVNIGLLISAILLLGHTQPFIYFHF